MQRVPPTASLRINFPAPWRLARGVLAPTLLAPALLAATLGSGCLKVDDTNPPEATHSAVPGTSGELLARYVTAMGGEAKLRGIEGRTIEADLILSLGQDCSDGEAGCIPDGSKGTFVLHSTADGRMYRRVSVGTLVDERGFDGKVGWQIQPDPPRVLLDDPSVAATLLEDALLHWYFDLAQREIIPELQPPRDADEAGEVRPLDGVLWQRKAKDLPHRERWFDRSSGLLHEEIELDGEPGAQARRVVSYTDYKDVDGIKMAHHIVQVITQGDHQQKLDFQVTKIEHKTLAGGLFQIPQLAAPAPTPDPFISALATAKAEYTADPKSATGSIAYARAAWAASHFDAAQAAAERTLKIDKREPEAMWLLARISVMKGKWSQAKRWVKQAASAGFDPRQRDMVLAAIKLHKRDYASAAKLYDKAGATSLAQRYQAFEGKPFLLSQGSAPCRASLPLLPGFPAAVIEVEVEGEKLRLLVDTTAPDLIVGPRTATRLVLTSDTRTSLGPDKAPIGHGKLDELSLGDMTVLNLPVDIYPEEAFAGLAAGIAIDGVLGTRIFQDGILRFDVPGGRLDYVRGTAKCRAETKKLQTGKPVRFWLHQTHAIYMRAHFGSLEGLYLFNTGMRGAGITASDHTYGRAGVAPPPLQPGRASYVNVDTFRLGSDIKLGTLRGAYGYMQDQVTGDQFRFDGMIGYEAVADRSYAIDYPGREVYFSAPTATAK
ncbi:MAG: aspartyl protease family protein [Nannocystaceae bacterium]